MRPPTDADIRERWDAFADLYESHFFAWSQPALCSALSALSLNSVDCEECTLLDVGCGPGQDIAIIRAYAPQCKLVALDYSPEMITKATVRAAASRAEARIDDAQSLQTVADCSVDRLLSNLCIHIVPDADKAIAAFFRVLKPGGCGCASVWGSQASSPQFTLLSKTLAACAERGEIPKDLAAPKNVRNNFHMGQNDEDLRKRFLNAGFERVTSWHVECLWPEGGTGPGEAFAKSWTTSMVDTVKLLEKLTKEQQAKILDEMASQADAILASGRPIGCDVVLVFAEKPEGTAVSNKRPKL